MNIKYGIYYLHDFNVENKNARSIFVLLICATSDAKYLAKHKKNNATKSYLSWQSTAIDTLLSANTILSNRDLWDNCFVIHTIYTLNS